MKKMKLLLERNMLSKYKQLLMLSFIIFNSTINVFATSDNGLLDALGNSTETILQKVVTTYNKFFPLILVIILIGIAFSGTNEKILSLFRTALIWLIIATVGLNCLNLIINTIMWISSELNNTGSSTIIPSGE